MSVVTLIGRLVTLTIVVTVLMPIVIGLVVEVTIVEVGMTVVTTEGDKLKNSS